mmetsp:Transcript_1405/g.3137  ORF Transcript_1405/g.3137 Transcript_1405/m.3137 type:complete len:203 (-) Transcript_1405:22-630(-)
MRTVDVLHGNVTAWLNMWENEVDCQLHMWGQVAPVVHQDVYAWHRGQEIVPHRGTALVADGHRCRSINEFPAFGVDVDAIDVAPGAEHSLPHQQRTARLHPHLRQCQLSPRHRRKVALVRVQRVAPLPHSAPDRVALVEALEGPTLRPGRRVQRRMLPHQLRGGIPGVPILHHQRPYDSCQQQRDAEAEAHGRRSSTGAQLH